MATEVNNRGSIGKFYKEMFPVGQKNKSNTEITIEINENPESGIYTKKNQEIQSNKESEKSQNTQEIETKTEMEKVKKLNTNSRIEKPKKKIEKPTSCARVRRRSRIDRNNSKTKRSVIDNIGAGTTIIVIQKNDKIDGEYSSREMSFEGINDENNSLNLIIGSEVIINELEDFNGLEKKIREESTPQISNKFKYKSENRHQDKRNIPTQSFLYLQHKGKPPLRSTNSSQIPRLGERKTSLRQKYKIKNTSHHNYKTKKSKSGSNSIDFDKNNTNKKKVERQKRTFPTKYNNGISQKANDGIEDLIQKKKDALGIKPLESSMKNYKAVINENKKLQKVVEEQKIRIKKMRQERVQQFQELTKQKEDKKKLEHYIKHETPAKPRKNLSNYRKGSRDSSTSSIGHKIMTKSPSYRFGSEYTKSSKDLLEDKNYQLEESETVKRLGRKNTQQPKIGGKEHSEVISTEILKKSTHDLMQNSFNNFNQIEKIYKMEKYEEGYEKSIPNFDEIRTKKYISGSNAKSLSKHLHKLGKNNLQRSFQNDNIEHSEGKQSFEMNAKKLKFNKTHNKNSNSRMK